MTAAHWVHARVLAHLARSSSEARLWTCVLPCIQLPAEVVVYGCHDGIEDSRTIMSFTSHLIKFLHIASPILSEIITQ